VRTLGIGHKCTGRRLDCYIKQNDRTILTNEYLKMKCKLVKVADHPLNPKFHFEIDGKIYFYEFRGIKSNFEIALFCTKWNGKTKCRNTSFILPSDSLKQIIQNTPNCNKYPKNIDKSDPRVFDIQNYDVNSFDIGKGHSCSGTEIENYKKMNNHDIKKVKCKLLKIENNRGHPKFHFEIDEKIYFYGLRGIKADYKIVLCCPKRSCLNSASILPSEFLKQLIQDSPKNGRYSKVLNISDPRAYDINNYDSNSFEIRGSHKCQGIEHDVYIEKIHKKREISKNNRRKLKKL
jgi:hypothetical protein